MLDPAVRDRLRARHQQLVNEGKVTPADQLDRYYAAFRAKFGPDRLAALDGEPLLEAMHGQGSKDSLAYWLEFKNDDEFPALFGSIAGGSALKFGVFKRKETGAWETAGEGNAPTPIAVAEAVAIARRQRDELVRGDALLRQVPVGGTDDDYARLQAALDRESPVSDSAWGHKYFSLLYPDRIDPYHSTAWQQFHLVKLLQQPPAATGRYACAGRFVAAAAELGTHMKGLTVTLGACHGGLHRYWRVGTSDGTEARNRWPLMRDGGFVAVGWPKLGDLSDLDVATANSSTQQTPDSKEWLLKALAEHYPAKPAVLGRARAQIVKFVNEMKAGDWVLACDGGTVLGVGRVTGPYAHTPGSDFPHRRPVEWLSLDEWRMPVPEGLLTTAYLMKKSPANLLEAERRVQTGGGVPPVVVPDDRPPIAPAKQPTPLLPGLPGRVQSALDRKGQVVLYGPPGTGKTFWGEQAARDLAAYSAFGRPFAALAGDEQARVTGGDRAAGLVRVCCFHPAYGYEDFIEGYRPEAADGKVGFRLRDGLFKLLCRDAAAAPDRKFYLVVDEINRGDIPRIFGELLTVLEKDKRGKAVVLPVSGEPFRVPPNVFLIGTMNTADRSISLLDAALRRRFAFVEVMPDASVLRGHVVAGLPLGPWLEALNRRVCQYAGRDARNLQVGHSYLMHGGQPIADAAVLRRALQDDIVPLLAEYCYEDFAALKGILGTGLVDAENRRVRHELFDAGAEGELIQALLASCPEVTASPDALAAGAEPNEPADADEDEEGDGQ
jgi:5-methylcytosine-specific restriction protein B